MSEFSIELHAGEGGVGTLSWAGATSPEVLAAAVAAAADDALLIQGLRRVEVSIPARDRMAMRALHSAGFRREGRRRQAYQGPDGTVDDVLVYGRLVDDVAYGRHGHTSVLNSVMPRTRLIAHALFTNRRGQVLLLETTYKPEWEMPGGIVEPGESPRLAAQREIAEELGIQVTLGRPLVVDWMPPYLGWDDAVEFVFDGQILDDDRAEGFTHPDAEIAAAHWVAPGDIAARVAPLSARRLAWLLANPDAPTRYFEDGRPA